MYIINYYAKLYIDNNMKVMYSYIQEIFKNQTILNISIIFYKI